MAKSEDRFLVRASQDVSLDGEIWGAEVHMSDGSTKTYGIAGADGQAEAARKEAETSRVNAEAKRAEDEEARTQAESARVTAEQERAAQQVKNNADQAANNAAAQGLIAVIVEDYDPVTLKPNGSGQNGKMYLVPMPEANAMAEAIPVSFALTPTDGGEYTARQVDARSAAAGDVYVEWLWINNQFERIGLSTATLDPITTDHIDAVVSGESPQGKQVLTLTGLTYLWTKLKTAFAAIAHKHVTGDVTGLDTALGDKATKAELKTVQDSLDRWSSATLNKANAVSGAVKYLQIGKSVYVSVWDLKIPNGVRPNDNSFIIASGLPKVSTDAGLLVRHNGTPLRVRLNQDGQLCAHWPNEVPASSSEFYGFMRMSIR